MTKEASSVFVDGHDDLVVAPIHCFLKPDTVECFSGFLVWLRSYAYRVGSKDNGALSVLDFYTVRWELVWYNELSRRLIDAFHHVFVEVEEMDGFHVEEWNVFDEFLYSCLGVELPYFFSVLEDDCPKIFQRIVFHAFAPIVFSAADF